MSSLSGIGALGSGAFRQADRTLQSAAAAMTQVSSGGSDPVSTAVDLTKARTDVQLGVRAVNAESKMQKALLDIFV